ncbi:MAG: carboxypeptidase-like regulatory domain-containing protein, partial [Vicinamibacterales bacterium]
MDLKTSCCGAARVLALLVWPALAGAQSSMGTVSGTVTDAAGAVVPGASVTLVNQDTNVHSTRVTNNDGHFVFVNARPGTYVLTFELTGF